MMMMAGLGGMIPQKFPNKKFVAAPIKKAADSSS